MRRIKVAMPKKSKPAKKAVPAIVPIQCDDKLFDTDPPQDHPASMPRGSRIAVVADPGRGKSSFIKNAPADKPWALVVGPGKGCLIPELGVFL